MYNQNLILLHFLLLFAFWSCNQGAGNEELQSKTYGIELVALGTPDEQNAWPNVLIDYPIEMQLISGATGKPLSDKVIKIVETSNTGAKIIRPKIVTDDTGIIKTDVRASAIFDSTTTIEITVEGTSLKKTFTIKNNLSGTIDGFKLDTTNGSIEIAGEPFGFIITAVDFDGNPVLDFNQTMNFSWLFEAANSWRGDAPVLPPLAMECVFVNGICKTAEIYIFTDSREETYGWVGEGESDINDVFAHKITVLPNVPSKLVIADSLGGPAAGANAIVDAIYTADDSDQVYYGAIIDKAGNFVQNAGSVSWIGSASFLTNYLSSNSGTAVLFSPTKVGVGELTISKANYQSGVSNIEVTYGQADHFSIATENNSIETAGDDFTLIIRALDRHNNLVENYTGGFDLVFTLSNHTTGNELSSRDFFDLTILNRSYPIITLNNSRGEYVNTPRTYTQSFFFGEASVGAANIELHDATNVSPVITLEAAAQNNHPEVSGSTSVITVNKGTLTRLSLHQGLGDDGLFYCDSGEAKGHSLSSVTPLPNATNGGHVPAFCLTGARGGAGADSATSSGYLPSQLSLSFQSGVDVDIPFYLAVEDYSGNFITNVRANWYGYGSFDGLVDPLDGANTFDTYHVLLSPSDIESGAIGVRVTEPGPYFFDEAFWRGWVNEGILDHYDVEVWFNNSVTNPVKSYGSVRAGETYYLVVIAKDVEGNVVKSTTGATNFNINIACAATNLPNCVGANESPRLAPDGTAFNVPAAFETLTFTGGYAFFPNFQLNNADDVIEISLDDGVISTTTPLTLQVNPGPIMNLKIRTGLNGLGDDVSGTTDTITTDTDIIYFLNVYDEFDNFVNSSTNGTWTGTIMPGTLGTITNLNVGVRFQPSQVSTGESLNVEILVDDPLGGPDILLQESVTIDIEPGNFVRFLVETTNAGVETAGVSFSTTVTMKDADGNTIDFDGNRNLTFSISNTPATYLNQTYSFPAQPFNALFTDGVVVIPNFTVDSASSNKTFFVYDQSTIAFGSINPFVVEPNVINHIYVTSSEASPEVGSNVIFTAAAKDAEGNTITTGAASTSNIDVTLTSPAGVDIVSHSGLTSVLPADLSGANDVNISGDLIGGIGQFSVTSTGTGLVNMTVVSTAPGNARTVVPTTFVADNSGTRTIEFVAGYLPPTVIGATGPGNNSKWNEFRVVLKDQYGNIIAQNNSDKVQVRAVLTATSTIVGTSTRTLVNGVATFTDISYPKAEGITLEARLLDASDTPVVAVTPITQLVTINPGGVFALVTILDGQSLVEGVGSIVSAVTGTINAPATGANLAVTVRAVDVGFNFLSNVNVVATISSSDAGPPAPTHPASVNVVNGIGTFNISHSNTGSFTVSIASIYTDYPSSAYTVGAVNPTQTLVKISGQTHVPGAINAAAAITGAVVKNVGVSFNVEVLLTDAFFNTVTDGDAVAVTLVSDDPNATIVPTGHVAGDGTFDSTGVATFTVTNIKAGTDLNLTASTIVAYTDHSSANYTVNPGTASQTIVVLEGQTHVPGVTLLAQAITGSPTDKQVCNSLTAQVKMVDAYYNVVDDDTTNVALSLSTGTDADLIITPANQSLTNGIANFSISHMAVFSGYRVTSSGGLANIPSSTYNFLVSTEKKILVLLPDQTFNDGERLLADAITPAVSTHTLVAGNNTQIAVQITDSCHNSISLTDTIDFVSTDPNQTTPVSVDIVGGVGNTPANDLIYNSTVGTFTISGSKATYTSVASSAYTVTAGAATQTITILPGQTYVPGASNLANAVINTPTAQTANVNFNIEVRVVDVNFNTVVDTRAVTLAASTGMSIVTPPAGGVFSGGIATFVVKNILRGTTHVLTPVSTLADNASVAYTIDPGPLEYFLIMLPGQTTHTEGVALLSSALNAGEKTTVTAGTSFNIEVRAVDANYNLIPTYVGSKNLSFSYTNASNGPTSGTPIAPPTGNYTFTAGSTTISSASTVYNSSDVTAVLNVTDTAAVKSGVSQTIPIQSNILNNIKIRSANNNGGILIDESSWDVAGADPTFYSAGYDAYGNYKADTSVNWEATRSAAGDLNGSLSLASGVSTTLDVSNAGIGDITLIANHATVIDGNSGVMSIYDANSPTKFLVELSAAGNKTSGTQFQITLKDTNDGGGLVNTFTGARTINWSTIAGDGLNDCGAVSLSPVLPTSAVNFTAGVATTALNVTLKLAESDISITAEDNAQSSRAGTLEGVDVVAGAADCIGFRDDDSGGGNKLTSLTLNFNEISSNIYAVNLDAYGNYVSDQSVTFSGTDAVEYLPYPLVGLSTQIVGARAGTGNLVANGTYNLPVTINAGNLTWNSFSVDADTKLLVSGNTIYALAFHDVGGSAWRTAGTQTWYSEASSATRGIRDDYPARTFIIGTDSGLDIIDSTTNKLFMRFQRGVGRAIDSALGNITSIATNDNLIYVGMKTSNNLSGALIIIDLSTDKIYRLTESAKSISTGGVSTRNSITYGATALYSLLGHNSVTSLSATGDYLAIGFPDNVQVMDTNGTTLYQHADNGSLNYISAVNLQSDGKLYFAEDGVGLNRSNLNLGALATDFITNYTYDTSTFAELVNDGINNISIAPSMSSHGGGQHKLLVATNQGLSVIDEHGTDTNALSANYTYAGTGNSVFDQVMYFGGGDGEVIIPDKVGESNTDRTVEFLFRLETTFTSAATVDITLFDKGNGSVLSDYGIYLDNTDGRLKGYIRDSGGLKVVDSDDIVSWTSGRWYHVAMTVDGNDLNLWVDGINKDTLAISAVSLGANAHSVILGSNGTSEYLRGAIDEFRLTTTPCDPCTVPVIPYTDNVNTVYLFHFDQDSGDTANDSSSSPSNGNLSGLAWFSNPIYAGTSIDVSDVKASVLAGAVTAHIGTKHTTESRTAYSELSGLESGSVVLNESVTSKNTNVIDIFYIDSSTNVDILMGLDGTGLYRRSQ